MGDRSSGNRDKRGNWRPNEPIANSPLFTFPPQPLKFLRWLPKYFFPWNLMFMGLAAVFWFFLTPDKETMKTLALGWIFLILVRNSAAVLLVNGLLELRLYFRRSQGNQYKYNPKWPSENPTNAFIFKKQGIDGIIRTFTSGVPIWTAYEVLILWFYANGWGFWTTFLDNPVWLIVFALLMPLYHEVHFYLGHRLLHVPALYKRFHRIHHLNVNPSPWSSLAMHPVEHLLYFSDLLIHLILPSHPLLLMYNCQITGTGAVVGHIGFEKIVTGADRGVDTGAYAHYLHHKYFEVNYSDGAVNLDRLAGTFHDGSEEGYARMEARRAKRRAQRRLGVAANRET